jgi:NAD(P)-dependent dehydrogenase (short-subunit alcohol dehydrogenase family)
LRPYFTRASFTVASPNRYVRQQTPHLTGIRAGRVGSALEPGTLPLQNSVPGGTFQTEATFMRENPGMALVTGAGSGIGRQLALELARRGWRVAGLDCQPAGLTRLEGEMAAEKRNFASCLADVTDARSMREPVYEMEHRLGPVDLLIACAGVAGETPAVGMDPVAIARIIGINLVGVSNTIAAVLPGMLERRRGHVVAVSSLASFRGLPRQMGYCASKAGLNALMQSLGLDVAPFGVRVTTVCPGHTHTPQATCMYKSEYLRPVEATAREILWAIDRNKRFHAFPWGVVRQLRCMRVLPERWQARLLERALARLKK